MNRPVYVLHLRPESGVDGERALRALLKVALRTHGLRAGSKATCSETSMLE